MCNNTNFKKQTPNLNKNTKTEIINGEPSHIKNFENKLNTTKPLRNISEKIMNILDAPKIYSLAHCISADLCHTPISKEISTIFRDHTSHILQNINLIPGEITTLETERKNLDFLINRDRLSSHNFLFRYLRKCIKNKK